MGTADAILSDVHLEGVAVNGNLLAADTSSGSNTAQLQNCVFKKCYVTGNFQFNSNIENVNIEQCIVGQNIIGTQTVMAQNLMIANCYIM